MLSQVDTHIDTREGSLVQTAIGPVAWYLEGIYMLLKNLQDNAYPATAVGDSLDQIVQTRGLTRKAATAAVRKGTFDAVSYTHLAAAKAQPAGVIKSATMGDTTVSYDNSAVTIGTEKWGSWNATQYGPQLATLARQVGMGGMYVI